MVSQTAIRALRFQAVALVGLVSSFFLHAALWALLADYRGIGIWLMVTFGICLGATALALSLHSLPGTRLPAFGVFFFTLVPCLEPSSLTAGLFGLLALLMLCVYQERLARRIHHVATLRLIERAYRRPLYTLLVALMLWSSMAWADLGSLSWLTSLSLVIILACPLWGFIYVSIVAVELHKAVVVFEESFSSAQMTNCPSGF